MRVRLGRRERWSDPTTRRECASDGSFAFSGLAPGRYRLRASRTTEIEFEGNRFEYTEHEVVLPISLAPGDEVSGVELKPESQPLSWVALRIVDASGEPVEGVIAWSDANPRVPQGQERMSDEDGIVLLPLAVPAQTRVRIDLSFPAKEIAGEAVDHSEAIERLTSSMDSLRLEQLHLPEVVHEVTILGADGGPLDPDDIFGPELRGPGWVVALPDGTLKAAHPPGAGLKLRLSVSGHPRQEVSFTADECRAGGPLTATLVGGVTVRGRIVAPDGLPFAGNAVLRSGSPYGGERNLEPDGSFEFRRVARGPLVIAATLSRDARLEAAWGFHTNSEDVLDVGELRVGGRFRGTVTVEGADDGSGTSVVIAERRWRRYVPEFARTTTAADGSFSLAAIAVPDAQLEVRRKGFAPVILRVGDLDPGTLIAVHLDERPGSLRIRLEPAPSRSAGLQFFVRNAESTARFLRRGFRRAARSPEWGKSATYEIDDPPAGAFVLECETKDYASFDVTGSVHVEAGRTDEVVLRLTRE